MTSVQASAIRPARAPIRGGRAQYLVAALCGLLAAGISISVGHLVAAILAPSSSPLLAVGSTFIDLTPEALKSFAIDTFGQNDKLALIGGIVIVLAVAAIAIGIVAIRWPWVAVGAIAAIGLIGAAAAVLRPLGSPASAIPSLVGMVAGMAAFIVLIRLGLDQGLVESDRSEPAPTDDHRRRFLFTSAITGVVIAISGGLGIALTRRDAGAGVADGPPIPAPLDPLAAVTPGVDLSSDGTVPFFTPNGDFYRVDIDLAVPAIAASDWSLRIHGMVDREVTLSLEELLQYPTIERDITLACVSNQVGGRYVSNARWIGVALSTLLEEAGVQAGADQIVSRSVDGMSIGTPTAIALDGRDAMLAVAMNGEPLPAEHGFPVRMLVPGLYGYVSATKWLTELELTTFDAEDAYWVKRGWAPHGPIKTASRIDTPAPLAKIPAGKTAVAGVAWAQHRGVDSVQVRVDGGDWSEARLGDVDTIDTWRQWVYEWDASSGNHTLEVRATDADGEVQPEMRVEPFPSGATGWHSVVVRVT